MGGIGSGSQRRWRKKYTVEQTLPLELAVILRDDGITPRTSVTCWTRSGKVVSTATYVIENTPRGIFLILKYTAGSEDIVERVPIESVAQPYGGHRYWMRCPLERDGIPCLRRCLKLYLPPREKYFGCRKCHNLSYYSCNSSHDLDEYYRDFVSKYGPYPRKMFNDDFRGRSFYKYFRSRKAAKRWQEKQLRDKLQSTIGE